MSRSKCKRCRSEHANNLISDFLGIKWATEGRWNGFAKENAPGERERMNERTEQSWHIESNGLANIHPTELYCTTISTTLKVCSLVWQSGTRRKSLEDWGGVQHPMKREKQGRKERKEQERNIEKERKQNGRECGWRHTYGSDHIILGEENEEGWREKSSWLRDKTSKQDFLRVRSKGPFLGHPYIR